MSQLNQKIYEELIANEKFVSWTLGNNNKDSDYWNQWKKDNPEYSREFEEALKTVKLFKFKSPVVEAREINSRWENAKTTMILKPAVKKSIDILYLYRKVAAILVLPLLLLSAWFFYQQNQFKSELSEIQEYSKSKNIHVKAPLGGQLNITLPDGTEAWLNAGSELTYPAQFTGEQREVEMIGEVFFKVTKDRKRFLVKNQGPTVMVYGTEFNVHAYDNEDEVLVALLEGKISLTQNGKEVMLEPGELASYNKLNQNLIKQTDDLYRYTSWREDKYIFRDTPLNTIIKTLERRYNVDIVLADETLGLLRYDATINGEPLEQILDLLSFSSLVNYQYEKPAVKEDGSLTKAKVRIFKN